MTEKIVKPAASILPVVSLIIPALCQMPVSVRLADMNLLVAAAVLMMPVSGKRYADMAFSMTLAVLSVIFSLLYFSIPSDWWNVAFVLLAATAVLAGRVTHILKNAGNYEYLSTKITGWDKLQMLCREFYSSVLLGFAALLMAVPDTMIPNLAMLLLLLALYAIVLIRGLFSGASDEIEHKKSLLKKISRENKISPVVEPEEVELKYRVIYARISEFMEKEKPYLSEDFSIDFLARAMYTNRNYVSRVINACTKKNFNQYVNEYRVRYSIELFKSNTRLKIADLAHMSGFHSAVSYNMAFKLFMNVTPGEWCKDWTDGAGQA